MSSAHYFVKNYNIRQVIDLFCYTTLYPHTLTSTQKITRMYRTLLRRQKQITLNQNKGCQVDFIQNITKFRKDLMPLFDISQSSAQFKQTLQLYEQYTRDNMDPTQLINQCRPYSATSGKYYIFNNTQLAADPYGYYSGRNVGGRQPALGSMYYPDFPMDSSCWHLDPPMEYDDQVNDKQFRV